MYDTKSGLKTATVILGLIVSLIIILLSKIGIFSPVYPLFKDTFSSFQISNLEFFQNLKNDFDFFTDIAKYRSENEQLRAENTRLTTEYAKALITIQDLQSIKKQSDFDLKFNLEPVRIIKYSDSQTEVILNKGLESRIKVNDILILDESLVGIIIESNQGYARGRLIIASDSKVPVVLVESKTKGFVFGTNSSTLNLKEVPNNVELSILSNIVSAGTDGIVPYGLLIGQIDSIDSDQTNTTQSATVKSKIRFNDLRDLFVIIK